jgi:hypothetical protein
LRLVYFDVAEGAVPTEFFFPHARPPGSDPTPRRASRPAPRPSLPVPHGPTGAPPRSPGAPPHRRCTGRPRHPQPGRPDVRPGPADVHACSTAPTAARLRGGGAAECSYATLFLADGCRYISSHQF